MDRSISPLSPTERRCGEAWGLIAFGFDSPENSRALYAMQLLFPGGASLHRADRLEVGKVRWEPIRDRC